MPGMRGAPGMTAILGGPDTVRFSWLLFALVVSFVLPPLLEVLGVGAPSVRLGLSAVLLTSLFAVSRRRRTLWIGVALVTAVLALDWTSVILASRPLAIASGVPTIAFLVLVVASMVRVLLSAQRVTTDTILGGICVYLLLGLLWVSAFMLVETAQPGSLLLGGIPLSEQATPDQELFRYTEIVYFSFITLTTVGNGDVVPATSPARALAASEAIVGQLYVAIFVARLVGLHLAHSRT